MAFKTFVALDPLPASDLNTYLMKQAVIVCTSGTRPSSPVTGMLIFETDTKRFLVYGAAAWCTISPVSATVATSEATTSGSYTDLATAGPTVSNVQLGTSVLVHVMAFASTAGGGHQAMVSFAVSGATTLAAADAQCAESTVISSFFCDVQARIPYTSLTAGSNTFKQQYKVGSGISTNFARRRTIVEGLPV